MGIGWPQLLLIVVLILVLFGRGRISEMMGDFGKGIKSFKKGLSEDDVASREAPKIEGPAGGNGAGADSVESSSTDKTSH